MTALDRPYWIEALFDRREGWDAGAYPFNLPVVRDLDRLAFDPRVPLLIGVAGMAAIRSANLRRKVTSLAVYEDDIRRAVDRLFTGF